MSRNYKSAGLFTLLLLGLCLALPIPLFADSADSIILEHSEEWYTLSNTYVDGVSADDLDQDGTTEIVTVGRYETGAMLHGVWVHYGQIKIWNWNGTGLNLEHTENWTTTCWRGIRKVAIDDVDNDGTKEIVTVGYLFEYVPVWLYKGELAIWNWNGTLLELEHVETWYYTMPIHNVDAIDVWVGDVDNDGTKEMITCGWYYKSGVGYEAQLRIWNWNGTDITLEHSEEWEEATGDIIPVSVFAEDVDQDSVVEIVTGGYKRSGGYHKSQVRIWNWNETASTLTLEHNEEWGEFTSTNSSTVGSVFAEDLNNNGMTEIVTAGWKAPNQAQIRIWNWNETAFALKHSEEWNYTTGVGISRIYAADVNADGITELVSVGHMSNDTYWLGQLRMWQWNGTSLTLMYSKEWEDTDIRGTSVFVSDVDEDYLQEIVTVGYTHDGTRWNGQLRIWSFPDSTPPVADAGPDQTVIEDTIVTFNGSGSWDYTKIISYVWTFTDVTPQTLTSVTPTYNFTNPGIYTVTLNVTDVGGNWDTDITLITVYPRQRATAVYFNLNPNPATVGQKVTLKGILVDEFSQPLSNKAVKLYARPLAGSWRYITSLTTNGYGIFMWQATIPVKGTFIFAVYYPGSEIYDSTYNLAILIVQ